MPQATIGREDVGRIFELQFTGRDPRTDYLKVLGIGKKGSLEVTYHRVRAGKSRGFLTCELPIKCGECRTAYAYIDPTCTIMGGTGFTDFRDTLESIEDITDRVLEYPDCRFRLYEISDHAEIGLESTDRIFRVWLMPDHKPQCVMYLKTGKIVDADQALLECSLQYENQTHTGLMKIGQYAPTRHRHWNSIGLLTPRGKICFYQSCIVLEIEDITDLLEWYPDCPFTKEQPADARISSVGQPFRRKALRRRPQT